MIADGTVVVLFFLIWGVVTVIVVWAVLDYLRGRVTFHPDDWEPEPALSRDVSAGLIMLEVQRAKEALDDGYLDEVADALDRIAAHGKRLSGTPVSHEPRGSR